METEEDQFLRGWKSDLKWTMAQPSWMLDKQSQTSIQKPICAQTKCERFPRHSLDGTKNGRVLEPGRSYSSPLCLAQQQRGWEQSNTVAGENPAALHKVEGRGEPTASTGIRELETAGCLCEGSGHSFPIGFSSLSPGATIMPGFVFALARVLL